MPDFFSSYEQGLFSLLKLLAKNWGTTRAQAAINKYRDYTSSRSNIDRLKFHNSLFQIVLLGHTSWESHDYGEGYYYQGLKALGITGLRDTDARIEAMGLKDLVAGKSVLEIGCNSGFLSLGIAQSASNVTGIEINPHLIDIAIEASKYLNIENASFSAISFEDYVPEETFDCVLSFANHATYDGNTKQSLEDYFRKCADCLNDSGLFVFESHPPAIEKDKLHVTIDLIEELFTVSIRKQLEFGTFLDSGRIFLVGTRRADR